MYSNNNDNKEISKTKPIKDTNLVDNSVNNNSSLSPVSSSKNVSYPSQGIVILLSPSYAMIYNKDIINDNNLSINGKPGFNLEVGYFIKLSRLISVGAGVGYSSYKTEMTSESFSEQVHSSDNGHQLINYIEMNQLYEELNLSYIDIPVYLEFGNPNVDRIGFYGRFGIKTSFNVKSNFYGEGTYTSWGDYPECSVTLYNIPELGYYSDKPIYNNEESVNLNPVNFSLLLSGGVSFPISNYIILKVGANLNMGLSDISDDKSDSNSSNNNPWEYKRLLNNSSKSSIRSYGIEIGLIYNLRLY